jgi:hypothetical protein
MLWIKNVHWKRVHAKGTWNTCWQGLARDYVCDWADIVKLWGVLLYVVAELFSKELGAGKWDEMMEEIVCDTRHWEQRKGKDLVDVDVPSMFWNDIEIRDEIILNFADRVDSGIVSRMDIWNTWRGIRCLPWIRKTKLVLLKIGGDPNISVPESISADFERGELPLERADSFWLLETRHTQGCCGWCTTAPHRNHQEKFSSQNVESLSSNKRRQVHKSGSQVHKFGKIFWGKFVAYLIFPMTYIENPASRLMRHANQWSLCSWLIDRNRWFLRRGRGFDARRPFPGYCMWLGRLISFWTTINLVVSTIDWLIYRWERSSNEAGMRPRNELNDS